MLPCNCTRACSYSAPLLIIQSCLLALNGRNNLSGVPTRAELQVPNSLPSTSSQTAISDGNADGGTDESGLDMSLWNLGVS